MQLPAQDRITWEPILDYGSRGSRYTAHSGVDREGNTYYLSAGGDVVTVTLPDGRMGSGWTPTLALDDARGKAEGR